VGDVSLTQFWLATGLGLYVLAVLLGLLVYTPTLRNQIRVLDSEGPSSPAFQALSKRATLVGVALAVDVVIIVFLMVTKPTI
jgi:uncharacterized membrane protein